MRGTIKKVAVVAVLIGLMTGLMATPAIAGARQRSFEDRGDLLKVTNNSRRSHHVHRVDLQARLSELARRHSVKMARKGTIFHTSNPARYYLKGRKWSWWGENVGMTPHGVRDVHKAFMHSSGHRANILNRSFKKVAIGTVWRDGILYVTVFFYRP
jgi:uncharacterized protein YkwD